MPSSDVKSYIFRNTGNLMFDNAGKQWGIDISSLSNGAALGDFDNDGDFDIVVNNVNQPAFIWQNHAEDLKNNFLKIVFSGNSKNVFGIGAKVIVSHEDGFRQIQEMQLSRGFQSSVEPCLIFGLGKRSHANIIVVWTDGKSQIINNSPASGTIILEQKNAINVAEALHDKIASSHVVSDKKYTRLFSEIKNSDLEFKHLEDDYNDFKREPLLPHQFAKNGPALVAGDVNGDGRDDLYIGGAKGQAGAIFISEGNDKFSLKLSPVFETHNFLEDTEAIFADFDNDSDLDLYVVSGGNEDMFRDRIYWNDSKGNFIYKNGILPPTLSSGGAVVAFDLDKDGDLDIFRGGQVTTGSYPLAPRSYLFQNNNGVFSDITPDFLKNPGMVSTAKAADINNDNIADLVIAGEYMPVTILTAELKPPFFTLANQQAIAGSTGWWNCLKTDDIDDDGDIDIVAGNHGLNSQMKPTIEQPVTIDAADIDINGSLDCVISYYIQGKSYPMPSRDELLDQVPSLKAKFTSYAAYADATAKDLFSEEQFTKAVHLKAEEFRSGIFFNDANQFRFIPFPNEAQAFPVRDFLITDFNKDRWKDLLLVGNNFAVRAQSGRYDAGKGMLLSQHQKAVLSSVPDTGFFADKDARRVIKIDNYIIVANNNDNIQIFKVK